VVNYEIVLKNLENSLNGSLKKESAEVFLNSVQSLKQDFNKGISTKFLKNLMVGFPSRAKTKRINYLLKKSGLITKKQTRGIFKEWVLNSYNTEVKTYAFDKDNKVYLQDFRNEEIGNLSLQNKSEVLRFVEIA